MSEPPQLALFSVNEQQLYSVRPLDVQDPQPLSKAESSYPPEEPHFSHLYQQSHSFNNCQKVMAIPTAGMLIDW